LIVLNFYVFYDGMAPCIGCGNRQHQPNSEIGLNTRFHPCRAGMKQRSSLRRLFGNFKGNLRRQMERGG